MKDTYIIRVDHMCSVCGAHNKENAVTDEKVEVVACYNCGAIIMAPEGLTENDIEVVDQIIERSMDRRRDAVL
jgi:NMD protein affecting ribosome stability and mRNA decay